MKTKSILTALALFASITINADPLLITFSPILNPSDGDGENPRAPILVPVLYLDGYTLTTGNGTLGSTIQLLDEDDNVVFSTFIYIEGDIELPETLSGTYTIRVIRGSQTFEGEITL